MTFPLAHKITHQKYLGSDNTNGYTGPDRYAPAQPRDIYGCYPLTSDMPVTGDYSDRVVSVYAVLVPDPQAYAANDKVTLPTYGDCIVSEDIQDMSLGPFGFTPGGVIVVKKV